MLTNRINTHLKTNIEIRDLNLTKKKMGLDQIY